ncbi:MAG: shikimate kinase [Chitinophagaceae bacterium]|nr:shikimate kinase [Chitinophagaceae bacterium]
MGSSNFETQGENYFREKESQILRELKVDSDSIIACGGGTPCFNDNISWMNKNGKTIWLKTDVSAILQRVLQEQNKRPLLKKMNEAEILFFIEQKLKEREPFYKQANIVLNTKDINENTIVNLNIK